MTAVDAETSVTLIDDEWNKLHGAGMSDGPTPGIFVRMRSDWDVMVPLKLHNTHNFTDDDWIFFMENPAEGPILQFSGDLSNIFIRFGNEEFPGIRFSSAMERFKERKLPARVVGEYEGAATIQLTDPTQVEAGVTIERINTVYSLVLPLKPGEHRDHPASDRRRGGERRQGARPRSPQVAPPRRRGPGRRVAPFADGAPPVYPEDDIDTLT